MFVALGFSLLVMLIVGVVGIGVPILIGVLVYKDARKRVDCNPVLWCLVSALVPSFIGLIVYLVIRGDYPLKGSPEAEMRTGSQVNEYGADSYEQTAPEKQGFPTWGKVLIALGIIIAVLFVTSMVALLLFGYHRMSNAQEFGYLDDDAVDYIMGMLYPIL